MHIHPFALAAAVLLAGCSSQQLQQAGVPAAQAGQIATVTQAAVADGQLFCAAAGQVYQAGAVKVTNATAASVASACAVLEIGSQVIAAVPTPAAAGTTVTVASVPPAVAAAVDATKPAS